MAAVRPPPPFSQAAAVAAGSSGGKFGRCRSIWRQVLAAAGPLQGRYSHPSFNGAAAVEYSLCYLQVLCCCCCELFSLPSSSLAVSLLILFKLLFLLVSFQTRTRTMQNCNLVFMY